MPLQATLEEVVEADVLIHVMDGSGAQMLQQRRAVLSILQQLGKSQLRSLFTCTDVVCACKTSQCLQHWLWYAMTAKVSHEREIVRSSTVLACYITISLLTAL